MQPLRHVLVSALAVCVLLMGCADAREAPENACAVASSMNSAALFEADLSAPACESDQDCVIMTASISCPDVEVGDCGRAAHRLAAQHYAQSGVNQQICEAVKGSEFGCSYSVACAPIRAARCQSGACVADLQ